MINTLHVHAAILESMAQGLPCHSKRQFAPNLVLLIIHRRQMISLSPGLLGPTLRSSGVAELPDPELLLSGCAFPPRAGNMQSALPASKAVGPLTPNLGAMLGPYARAF